MLNNALKIHNSVRDDYAPSDVLNRFDNLILDICSICDKNQVTQTLTTLKPLIPYTKHFENLMDKIVENSCYNYEKRDYETMDALLNKVLRQFSLSEQLYLIANMHIYAMANTEKTTRLLKYFIRKIIKQRLLNRSSTIPGKYELT